MIHIENVHIQKTTKLQLKQLAERLNSQRKLKESVAPDTHAIVQVHISNLRREGYKWYG